MCKQRPSPWARQEKPQWNFVHVQHKKKHAHVDNIVLWKRELALPGPCRSVSTANGVNNPIMQNKWLTTKTRAVAEECWCGSLCAVEPRLLLHLWCASGYLGLISSLWQDQKSIWNLPLCLPVPSSCGGQSWFSRGEMMELPRVITASPITDSANVITTSCLTRTPAVERVFLSVLSREQFQRAPCFSAVIFLVLVETLNIYLTSFCSNFLKVGWTACLYYASLVQLHTLLETCLLQFGEKTCSVVVLLMHQKRNKKHSTRTRVQCAQNIAIKPWWRSGYFGLRTLSDVPAAACMSQTCDGWNEPRSSSGLDQNRTADDVFHNILLI